MESLVTQLSALPSTAGVYIFTDARGNVLYVGKAKNLRPRVQSYFRPAADLDPAKQRMVKKVVEIKTISTDNETEALVLEANLIREHQPPYNVVLRDDKYYLFIKITKEDLPRVFVTRRIRSDGARYFGPYSSARSVRATLRLLRRIFPFRGEKDSPHDIVFPHPLFATPLRSVPRSLGEGGSLLVEQYNLNIQNIIRFLQGKRDDIMKTLETGMREAAREGRYEQAAIWRDQLQALERLEGSQKVYLPRRESFDVVSIARAQHQSAANVFQIRAGKLLGKQTFLLSHRSSASAADTLRQFLLQYYSVAQDIPKVILIPLHLEDEEVITRWINSDNQPVLAVPQRGKRRQLVAMGETNAQQLLDEQQAAFESKQRAAAAHQELLSALGLTTSTTHRVETYDISNIQGQLATASMAVFVDGLAQSNQYRKFKMRVEGTPNDFAMIQETLRRRFAHHQKDLPSPKATARHGWPMPDLIIIDGGKGQLSSAKKVLDELQVDVPVISIAKREEEIFISGRRDPIRLPYNSQALYLVQRMRDEAHRFTITYHRLLRSRRQQRSILDEVPGIGPKTKKRLLGRFGSLKAMREAPIEALAEVVGRAKAQALKDFL